MILNVAETIKRIQRECIDKNLEISKMLTLTNEEREAHVYSYGVVHGLKLALGVIDKELSDRDDHIERVSTLKDKIMEKHQ